MFSQLQFVRLRAAEKALRDGRLDEAFRLVTAGDLRGHRKSVTVLEGLAKQFVERARSHYRADRFAEALSDLDKAEFAGATGDEVAELRRNVQIVAHEVRRQHHSRQEKVEAARRRIERGSLAAGQRLLDEAPPGDPMVANMKREAAHRAEMAEQLVDQADRLIRAGQLAAAMEKLDRAGGLDRHDERLASLRTELCSRVLKKARESLIEGRLARASDELAGLGPLGAESPERRELADALALAREAASALAAARFADARRHVMSIQRIVPHAKWAQALLHDLKQVDDLFASLAAGPLGERLSPGVHAAPGGPGDVPHHAPRLQETIALPRHDAGALPPRLLLLVDGGGSYLLLRGSRVSLGRAASMNPADVPLMGDLGEHHASIERVDEDYFIMSAKGAEIGGRAVHHGLLRDGDRVVLGRKAKVTFRVPSRRSTTAVLDLSDTTKMPHDVRRVVLFHHHATLGDGPQAHIRCRHAGPPLLLMEKDGALWIRQRNDGHVDGEARQLVVGASVEIGGASLVLSEWRPPGGAIG